MAAMPDTKPEALLGTPGLLQHPQKLGGGAVNAKFAWGVGDKSFDGLVSLGRRTNIPIVGLHGWR